MKKSRRLIELDDTGAWAVTTEEFLAQIHRSSELLREDKGEEARKLLENAFESRMNDPAGQSTLGLVYFKLGIYPRALAIYSRLVQEYPSEPTLRLNLGLAYLKTGQTELAARELEAAVGLVPNYRKAHGYLGLAYQRLGDWFGAKRAFEKAGAKHLAERMARFVKPDPSEPESDAPACGHLDLAYEATEESTDQSRSSFPGFMSEFPFSMAAPSSLLHKSRRPMEPVSVAELTAKSKLPEPLGSPFLISEAGYLVMDVQERAVSRLDGLHFLSAAHLSYEPLCRRYRGKECDEVFGPDDRPMYEIRGNGRLGFHPRGGVFSAVSLSGETIFVREEYLFAVDPALSYENGKIPGEGSMLVHLNGTGAVVLRTPTAPAALEVTPSSGVIVPAVELVGWFGRLLPKKASALPFAPDINLLELVGEGAVLFCLTQNRVPCLDGG